jgi:hypothetical protein
VVAGVLQRADPERRAGAVVVVSHVLPSSSSSSSPSGARLGIVAKVPWMNKCSLHRLRHHLSFSLGTLPRPIAVFLACRSFRCR